METHILPQRYSVRALGEGDLAAILALCAGNPLFFRHHPPRATRQSILRDMAALPPGKTMADKHYLGFFTAEEPPRLAAVLDLIAGWPRPEVAFIGLFMVAGPLQGRGAGSAILASCLDRLAAQGFARVRLAVDEGNPQSAAFWQKNGFAFTGERQPCPAGAYLPMERALKTAAHDPAGEMGGTTDADGGTHPAAAGG